MALTRLQIKDYVRAKLSELDSGKVKSAMLDVDINLAIRKVQKDLVSLGIKQFTKTAYLTGSIVSVPTDMLSAPNAIIDIKASAGTKNYFETAIATTNADIKVTAKEPGSVTNTTPIYFAVSCTSGATLAVTTTIGTTIVINVIANGTSHTGLEIIALINADIIASKYITASLKTGSTGVGIFNRSVGSTQLTSGTGTGWYAAKELTVEDYNRVTSNTFLNPTTTEPGYNRKGDSSGSNIIEFLPVNITYSMINYYYRFADLSSDASTNPLPDEYEELVLMDVMAKTYESLKQIAESQNKAVEYETKVKEIETKYRNALAMSQVDKTRIQSNDNP